MSNPSNLVSLLASPDAAILCELEPLLSAEGGHVDVALSAEAALAILDQPVRHDLVLVDAELPGMDLGRLAAAARDPLRSEQFPIVLISDSVTPELMDLLAEGAVDDILPKKMERPFWEVRLGVALRAHRSACDLEQAREASAMSARCDRLTGIYNRETILSLLFRETDRVQRLNSPLTIVLFDIDEFGHWNSRLGAEACDALLIEIAARTTRQLRSYDLLGRVGKDEFLVGLPGCGSPSATMLAERIRAEVFASPFQIAGETVRLSACFGLACSNGRSPLVVLREAEQALASSRQSGPESIQCFGECHQPAPEPVTFLSLTSGDELLAW